MTAVLNPRAAAIEPLLERIETILQLAVTAQHEYRRVSAELAELKSHIARLVAQSDYLDRMREAAGLAPCHVVSSTELLLALR